MQPQAIVEMPSGIFTISLDFELIWGTLDKPKHRRFRRLCAIEREKVIDGLLKLFAEYKVSATWCTVGHLFLDHGNDAGMRSAEAEASIFHGRDLIDKIRQCSTKQEVGSHSFTHMVFNDPGCTREIAEHELAECTRLAEEMGERVTSFAFPRNRIAHLDVLARHGFNVYRGQDMCWYERTAKRRWFHRAGHLLDIFRAAAPEPVLPVWHEEGLWEIPGSMLYTPSHGLRRFIPVKARVCRAQRGLRSAVKARKIFHLWFHPTDLAVRSEAMLDGLRQILESASELRERGELAILPMSGVVGLLNQQGPRHAAPLLEVVSAR